jgi:copper(I)-binding protein
MNRLVLLSSVVILAACGGAAKPAVKVADAWCRAAPVGAMAGACFMTLTAGADDRLVAVKTTAADHAEIHTMTMEGGVMRMRELPDGLPLPRGQAVRLAPGGEHIMIISPKASMAAGTSIPLTLVFAKAHAQSLTAPVKAAPMPGMAGMK